MRRLCYYIVMIFTKLSPSDFTKFERKNPYGNFYQSAQRAALRERMGFHSYLMGISETKDKKKKIVGAFLIVERNHEAWVQMGPVLDWNDRKIVKFFLSEIKKFAKKQGFWRVEIFPPVLLSTREIDGTKIDDFDQSKLFEMFKEAGFKHQGFTTEIQNKANRWVYVKDLSGFKTIYDAEMSFNGSTRKKLRKTRREVDVRRLTDKSELGEWIKALQESNERNGVPTRPLKYFEDLWDCFGEDAIFCEVRRKDNGELVSSEVDIMHPNEMVAFLAGTIEKNKHFNGSTAIKGWQIEECIKCGQKRLNLYGMDGYFSLDNPLLRFKGGLRGVSEEYIGGFTYTLNPVKLTIGKIWRRIKGIVGR